MADKRTAERKKLEEECADALRSNGRIPEMAVIAMLPDAQLEAVRDYHATAIHVA